MSSTVSQQDAVTSPTLSRGEVLHFPCAVSAGLNDHQSDTKRCRFQATPSDSKAGQPTEACASLRVDGSTRRLRGDHRGAPCLDKYNHQLRLDDIHGPLRAMGDLRGEPDARPQWAGGLPSVGGFCYLMPSRLTPGRRPPRRAPACRRAWRAGGRGRCVRPCRGRAVRPRSPGRCRGR